MAIVLWGDIFFLNNKTFQVLSVIIFLGICIEEMARNVNRDLCKNIFLIDTVIKF